MPYSRKVDNAYCQSKKLPDHMIRYTNVWSFKSNYGAKFDRFLHTIKAVLEFNHLLKELYTTENYDDTEFWNTVSKHLKTEHFISKKPKLLKKFFKSFYFKENLAEYSDKQDVVEQLNSQCLAIYKFDKNNMILLNSSDYPVDCPPIEVETEEKIPQPNETQDVVSKLMADRTTHYESPDLDKINASEYFKASAYSLFSAENEHLVGVLKNVNTSINPAEFYGLDSYNQSYNSIPKLSDLEYTFPDWVHESNSQCNQYTHFHRYVAVQSQLDMYFKMKATYFKDKGFGC